MRKKTEASFKRDVRWACQQLRWLFYVNGWEYRIVWSHDEHKCEDGVDVIAEMRILGSYLKFELTLYKRAYELYLDGELFPYLVHEFTHLWTEPLRLLALENCCDEMVKQVMVTNEALTERVARSLVDLPEFKKIEARFK